MDTDSAGPKLLRHFRDARTALAAGNLELALAEVEAAIALDGGFLAGQSLRDEILARASAGRAVVERGSGPLPWHAIATPVAARVGMLIPMLGMAAFLVVARAPLRQLLLRGTAGESRAAQPPAITRTSAVPSMAVVVAKPPAAAPGAVAAGWMSPRLSRLDVRSHWRASAIHVDDAALLRDLEEGVSE